MAKILNLDVLSAKAQQRTLVLNGVTYAVKDMSVENFIETTRTAQRLLKEEANLADRVEASIEMIKRSIPAFTDEVLRAQPLETLSKIVSFVRGEDDEDVTDSDTQEGSVSPGK